MILRLLYPADPLDPKAVDGTYADERKAAQAIGIATSVFSFEDFEAGSFKPRPAFDPDEQVLYRGWMLTPDKYSALVAHIERVGGRALTTPDKYRRCHHLPEWYDSLKDLTAETIVVPEGTDYVAALAQKEWPGYFVKDYVKSLSTAGGSLASNPSDVRPIVEAMKKYRGFVEGGVCIRRKEDFVPGSEHRAFVFKGRAAAAEGPPPTIARLLELLAHVA